jgi:hypothetical protein
MHAAHIASQLSLEFLSLEFLSLALPLSRFAMSPSFILNLSRSSFTDFSPDCLYKAEGGIEPTSQATATRKDSTR